MRGVGGGCRWRVLCHLEEPKETQLGLRAVEERVGEAKREREKRREEEREARKAEVRERAIKTSQ